MKRTAIAVALLSAALLTTVAARFAPVDVDNVPVERLAANLERQIAEQPRNVELRINLARVYAMAFARKSRTVPVAKPFGRPEPQLVPWIDHGAPAHQQFDVRSTNDPQVDAAARGHLTKAIAQYREVLSLAPANQVAKLGLGWALVQAGEPEEATKVLREVVAAPLPKDQQGTVIFRGQRSLTEEAARYLIPLLDPQRDRDEIEALRKQVRELERQPRLITPIAIPLAPGLTAFDIANDSAAVAFDVDGSALPKRWTWIHPNAAWLVFDRRGTGSITSGLQLFGNVTFWLFWRNGYDALRALDDDADGVVAEAELQGLALWHDRNSNGRSEPGEVRPLIEWGIVSLSCAYQYDASHPDEIAYSPRGVTLRDGTTKPTFDLILRRAPSSR